jgi:hypothetical protein
MKAVKSKTADGLTEVRIMATLDEVSQDPANVRKHSGRNLDAIVASLRANGQRTPIVIDKRRIILKGNGTYLAAQQMGLTELWVTITELEGAEAVRYAIADNRTAELAEWDLENLGATLKGLKETGHDILDLGWQDFEIEPILNADWSPTGLESLDSGDGTEKPKAGPVLLLTTEQREIVDQAIEKVREMAEDGTLSEGRCIELICAEDAHQRSRLRRRCRGCRDGRLQLHVHRRSTNHTTPVSHRRESTYMSRKVSFSGMSGRSSETGTTMRNVPNEEEFYIKLVAKYTVGTSFQYSWQSVVRNITSWTPTGEGGGPGFDPAYEVNNQDSPINTIYRAYREPNSGEVLFF